MEALKGTALKIYLESLKRYEMELVRREPIGQRVPRYMVQVAWINEELKQIKED